MPLEYHYFSNTDIILHSEDIALEQFQNVLFCQIDWKKKHVATGEMRILLIIFVLFKIWHLNR